MRQFLKPVCIFLLLTFACGTTFAGGYFGNIYRTEKRGIANVVSGFAELPIAVQEAHGEGDTTLGYFESAFKGSIRAYLRTASGIWDVPAGFVTGLQGGFPLEPETLFRR